MGENIGKTFLLCFKCVVTRTTGYHGNTCEFHLNASEDCSGVLGELPGCLKNSPAIKEAYVQAFPPRDFIFRL